MGKRKVALAFADTSSHGNDSKQATTRRSHRNVQKCERNNAVDSDSDDIDFVEEMPTPSSRRSGNTPEQRGQRLQQRLETKDQNHQHSVQRDEDNLRQQEEEDIMRAIELSKLEMEAEQRRSQSQEDWESGNESPLASQQPFNDSPTLAQASGKSLSSKGEGTLKGFAIAKRRKSPSVSSSTSENSEEIPFQGMEHASLDHVAEWKDALRSTGREDRFQTTGVANCSERRPPNSKTENAGNTEDTTEEKSRGNNDLWPDSSDVPGSDQPVLHTKGSRMRLRKRHAVDMSPDLPLGQCPTAQKVPKPPDCASLEQLDVTDGEDDEEVLELDVENSDGGTSGSESLEIGGESNGQLVTQLEVFKLVDTRKPLLQKHPFYAPRHVSKSAYTKVIYQLIQAYCCRLRQAQAKVMTRVLWGKPVVTGNCFSDTLVHRKRGSKSCAFYTLSDDSDEEWRAPSAKRQSLQRGEVSSSGELPRSKKRLVIEEDADSDFDDFIQAGHSKASSEGRRKLVARDVVEMLTQGDNSFQTEKSDVPQGTAKSRESYTPFQDLVNDESETIDCFAVQSDIDEMAEFGSDLSPPQNRTTCPNVNSCSSEDTKSSHHEQTDSQNSATDIFRAYTNSVTDGDSHGKCHTSKVASKILETDLNGSPGKRADQDSEASDEDSSDEQALPLSIPKNASDHTENIASLPNKPNGHTRNLNPPSVRNTSGTGPELEKLLRNSGVQKETVESGRGGENIVPSSSVAADSSKREEPSPICTNTKDVSFEEARYLFYQTELLLPGRQEGLKEKRRGSSSSLENSSHDDSQQRATLTHSIASRRLERDPSEDEKYNGPEKHHDNVGDSEIGEDDDDDSSGDVNVEVTKETDWNGNGCGQTKEEETEGGKWDEEDQEVAAMAEGRDHRDKTESAEEAVSEEEAHPGDGQEDAFENEEVIAGDDHVMEDAPSKMIGVECPLCGIKYPVEEIEAHASECNGPPSPRPEDLGEPQQELGIGGGGGQLLQGLETLDQVTADPIAARDTTGSAGTSQAGTYTHRNPASTDRKILKPVRGANAAIKTVQEGVPNSGFTSVQAGNAERSTPFLDENSSDSFSESADQLDAALLQLVEDNKLQLQERKRVRAPDRPAKRQKVAKGDTWDECGTSSEPTELCFLCNKQIPKSSYADHVQDEIDRSEAEKHLEDNPVLARRGLRSKVGTSGAAGGESSKEADHDPEQSGTFSRKSRSDDCTSWNGEPDCDSESGDSLSSSTSEGALFNPTVSESPIKAFRPISKQPMNLIDFKNQFNANTLGKRAATSSRRGTFKRGRRHGGRKRKRRGK